MTKKYSSFTEIDNDLKVLRLQREIAKESLKLDLNNAKTHLSPNQIMGVASFKIKQLLIDFTLSKGLYWLHAIRHKIQS
ncbi:DUF6327 family protein [Kriegella aquimaris]|uniref:Uncharacterized protein n=1 Tax=Kriegella aquimaris TaxID=192904 RepID=A0A1G9JI52_9FLAO|nr:hypothetical protein SAMN04488514_101565 [Kriegella aquimaris]